MALRFKTFRYELRPNAEQARALARSACARRFVFNWALARWRAHYSEFGESPTRAQLCRELTELKHRPGQEWMLDISSSVMQQAITDVWRSYLSFFRGQNRYPRFKSKKVDRPRFRYPAGVRVVGQGIFLPRIGLVRLKLSRPVEGRVKSVTVKRQAGRWFVLILTEFEVTEAPIAMPDPYGIIGIDLGLTRLATLSNGVTVLPPRFGRRGEKNLRRAARALGRKQKGSRNRQKQRARLASIHARIAARRRDFLHKLTTSIVATYDGFCVETLDSRGLARTKLSKGVLDASLGEFLRQVEYKADWQRKPYVAVGRFFPSTKTCGTCGTVNRSLERSVRAWRCGCGALHDRDLNAARNIRAEGLRILVAAGHADTQNACGAQVRPRIEAQGVEAGTPTKGCQTGSIWSSDFGAEEAPTAD
jgi:putative transposase